MRRKIIFLAVMAAVIAPVIVSCGMGKQRLYIYNWTYYTPDSVIEKFEDEFNARVIYDEFASNEDMFAKLKSSKSKKGMYDIVFPSKDFVPIMISQGMLERIDKTKVPNVKHIDPELLKRADYDPNMEYSVPYFYGAAGIVVNTAKVNDFQESWSIFARADLKNRMTMLDDMREVMGGALAYMGYSVNTVDPARVNSARDLVNNIWKPNLVKFDAEAFGKGYANGDFWVVHAYPEAVFEEIVDNPQLMRDTVFFIPREGGPSYVDSMVILKDARNIDLAHEFINFIHRPEIYAEFVDTFGLPATVNVPARALKKGDSWYSAEALFNTELVNDLGPSIDLYNDAWFNVIRAGSD
uniref:ABC transporter, periplasmic spermidine putrescine-binding protein PotD (TC 3.A.1.11.1) n=1 Tax=uncultured bacterium contig00007 TaxID=1181499 RepID=A0A806KSC8_9BACT|nr:ABC transporter, periplasmic spermidine putrescine-binding protein PotD (TC 3.A.1.11.1) [uncultured bacterium contig00007]